MRSPTAIVIALALAGTGCEQRRASRPDAGLAYLTPHECSLFAAVSPDQCWHHLASMCAQGNTQGNLVAVVNQEDDLLAYNRLGRCAPVPNLLSDGGAADVVVLPLGGDARYPRTVLLMGVTPQGDKRYSVHTVAGGNPGTDPAMIVLCGTCTTTVRDDGDRWTLIETTEQMFERVKRERSPPMKVE